MTVELTALAQYIASGLVVGAIYGLIGVGFLRRARHDRGTQPDIGRQHAVKANQVQARARHQRGQALQEFQRRHADVRGAVAPRALELQHDIPRSIALHPFVSIGPLPEIPGKGEPKHLSLCSVPLTLDSARQASVPAPFTESLLGQIRTRARMSGQYQRE